MDPVTVSLATIPERQDALHDVLRSLLSQKVDTINVYLNNYPRDWVARVDDSRIRWLWSQDLAGDLADSGKFYCADEIHGYHLTCDDDLIYPTNYVARLIHAIEDYQRQAVISFHGCVVDAPISGYYRSRQRVYPCLGDVPDDRFVNVAGTGVMGYHTDTVRVHVEQFRKPFMADIWMGIICQQQQVPQVVRAHPKHWIIHYPIDERTTIYHRFRSNDDDMEHAINEHGKWSIHYALRCSAAPA